MTRAASLATATRVPELPPSGPHAVVSLLTNDDRQIVTRLLGVGVVRAWQSDESFRDHVAAGSVRAIIWEISAQPGRRAQIPNAVWETPSTIPVLIRTCVSATMAREVARMTRCAAAAGRDLFVSVNGHDSWPAVLARVFSTAEMPQSVPLTRLLDTVDPLVWDILIAAVVVARCRTSVATLAECCQLPVRTLEARLEIAGVVAPQHLLGRLLALYAAWRFESRPETSLKAAAPRLGFKSASALARYLERHAGVRPRDFANRDGFCGLLERLDVTRVVR